jgi:L-iditol 2-dehydrogenase
MKSAVLVSDPGGRGFRVELTDGAAPAPGPGELVVEMKACGLCGTDLEKIRGEYTASLPVIGHEAVGIVSAVGDGVTDFAPGDRVFPHHHVPCHECYLCQSGNETMCDRYRSTSLVPGGFAQAFKVPGWNVSKGGVQKLPEGMGFEVASLIEPLACCVRAVGRCRVGAAASVLVAGAGPVGMMHVLLLKPTGGKVMVSDVSEARLEFAEKEGAGTVLNAALEDVPKQVKSETGGIGADLAIIASGSKAAILQGLRSVRKGGEVCLFGVPPKGSVLEYDISDFYNSEQRMVTSYGAAEPDVKEALKVLSSRGPEFARLITHRFPLARFAEAVDAASSARAMKVVVTP